MLLYCQQMTHSLGICSWVGTVYGETVTLDQAFSLELTKIGSHGCARVYKTMYKLLCLNHRCHALYTQTNNIKVSWESHVMWFFLYKVSKPGTSIEVESSLVIVLLAERGMSCWDDLLTVMVFIWGSSRDVLNFSLGLYRAPLQSVSGSWVKSVLCEYVKSHWFAVYKLIKWNFSFTIQLSWKLLFSFI